MKKLDITRYSSTPLKHEIKSSHEIRSIYNSIMNIAYELENGSPDEACINRYFNTLHELLTER